MTLNFIAAVLTLVGTLLSDILYAVVDPRIRLN
jgi:peptide/nickel transport system permease protein